MTIIIDTREQLPFSFKGYECDVNYGKLDTGDYSVLINGEHVSNGVSVERKSLNDLIGCFTQGRDRFERELVRMQEFKSCAIVVESPFRKLSYGDYVSKMSPYSAIQSVLSMTQKFRIPFLFAETRKQAEFLTFHFLRHYYVHETKSKKKR